VRIPYQADRRDDQDERVFRIMLSGATEALVLNPLVRGALLDDDPTPTMTVNQAEAPESAESLDFVLRLSEPSDRTVIVEATVTGVTAAAGTDFGSRADPQAGGQLIGEVASGAIEGAVKVPLLDDDRPEPVETLTLTVRSVDAATAELPITRSGSITDDD
jgi:hypothetical protein